MKNSKTVLLKSIRVHRWLAWIAPIALLMFGLSGISHPVMTWTGPRPAAFLPPKLELSGDEVTMIPSILARHAMTQASVVQVIPSMAGAVLQVMEQPGAERRYFSLKDEGELPGYDEQHAVWLARYYTGLKEAQVKSIRVQASFDDAYPWVNRLLPVYEIAFDTSDGLKAFVHTETNALGNLTNDWKTSLQAFFQNVHTWAWLEGWAFARQAIMSILLLSLLGMILTGLILIRLIRRQRGKFDSRGRHRLLATGLWVPLLAFISSGSFHLLYDSSSSDRFLPPKAFSVTSDRFVAAPELKAIQGQTFNGVSLVEGPGHKLFYRLSVPNQQVQHEEHNHKRFDGLAKESPPIYLDARDGRPSNLTDKDFALFHAARVGFPVDASATKAELVTQFGLDYDFRNKRLPVWRIKAETGLGPTIFIDTSTGAQVDRVEQQDLYELATFSYLHKWNFLVPWIGRAARDALAIAVLLGFLMMTGTGIVLMRRKRA